VRTLILTVFAMLAFAGNSLLCRLALADGSIDPRSFTGLRILSGALILLPFLRARGAAAAGRSGSAAGALALILYAAAFSWAYVSLDAGMGALLLFGSVQLTMLLAGFVRGERLAPRQWLGFAAALVGLVVQCAPGLTAPEPAGAAAMVAAGVAWGAYTLLGRGAASPQRATARNFALAVPLAALLWALPLGELNWTERGVLYSVASGALTSGLGYVIWYAALGGHSRSSAAFVQLSVPVLAAVGGVVFLQEALTGRFVLAGTLILAGIAFALAKPADAS